MSLTISFSFNSTITRHNQTGVWPSCTVMSLQEYDSSRSKGTVHPQKLVWLWGKSGWRSLCTLQLLCKPPTGSVWISCCVGCESRPAVGKFRGDSISVWFYVWACVCVGRRFINAELKLSRWGWLRPHCAYMGIRRDEATCRGLAGVLYCGLFTVNPMMF